jgi:hypothetical protein
MNPHRSLLGRYALFASLGLADLGLTWHLLGSAAGRVYESNPLAHWALACWGWTGLVAFKAALMALALAAVAALAHTRRRVAANVLSFSCLATALVVGYSCTLLGTAPACHAESLLKDDATLAVEGRRLDEQLRQMKAYRQVLAQVCEGLAGGRCSLEEAVARLAATERCRDRAWLQTLREGCSSCSDREFLRATILEHVHALTRDKLPEADARATPDSPGFVPVAHGNTGEAGDGRSRSRW